VVDEDTRGVNDSPFADIYNLQRTYGLAILGPSVAAAVLSHRAWLWGLVCLGICVADFISTKHRYLGKETIWFYPRVGWNFAVQSIALIGALTLGRSWLGFFGLAGACVWIIGSTTELRKFAVDHHIPTWRLAFRITPRASSGVRFAVLHFRISPHATRDSGQQPSKWRRRCG
jgi:hypothetical protein